MLVFETHSNLGLVHLAVLSKLMPNFGFDKLSRFESISRQQNVWMIQVQQAYRRSPYRIMVVLMAVILVMIWVTEADSTATFFANLPEKLILPPSHFEGAAFENQPVGAAIEKKLKADWTFNGRYQLESGQVIKVFSSAALSSVQQGLPPGSFPSYP